MISSNPEGVRKQEYNEGYTHLLLENSISTSMYESESKNEENMNE